VVKDGETSNQCSEPAALLVLRGMAGSGESVVTTPEHVRVKLDFGGAEMEKSLVSSSKETTETTNLRPS
jgi:hypothetical protein